jgi:hypothetical protein
MIAVKGKTCLHVIKIAKILDSADIVNRVSSEGMGGYNQRGKHPENANDESLLIYVKIVIPRCGVRSLIQAGTHFQNNYPDNCRCRTLIMFGPTG